MFRGIVLFFLTALFAAGATIKLYLKDGDYQLAREYQVQQDRVRFYSVERSQWEEIPLELVDLKKTESEAQRREASVKEEAAALAAEEKAEREMRREIERVPIEPGVYLIAGSDLKTIKPAESKVVGESKRRSILKVVTPIPIVSGKGTLEVDGEHSANVVDTDRPEFYIRLSSENRFGILKMGEHKGNRVVENLDIIPVTKEVVEQQNEVQVFRKQAADGLYRIWPMKPLEPGEYAVVEYTPATEKGDLNVQVWDFAYRPTTPSKPAK
jgi:hypothetical protein